MHFPYTPNRFSREIAIVGDVVTFNAATVTCESAPAGSSLDPNAESPGAAGRENLLDVEGVYTFVLGAVGEPGWARVAIRAFDAAIESWPRLILQVNGASHARRVFSSAWRELGDTVTWPAGTSKNPGPTRNDEAVDLMVYGMPIASDTMAAQGARRHDSAIDGRTLQ